MTDKERREALELLLDASSVAELLGDLVCVCADKAEHLATNWQDSAGAKDWTRKARKLDKLSASYNKVFVD